MKPVWESRWKKTWNKPEKETCEARTHEKRPGPDGKRNTWGRNTWKTTWSWWKMKHANHKQMESGIQGFSSITFYHTKYSKSPSGTWNPLRVFKKPLGPLWFHFPPGSVYIFSPGSIQLFSASQVPDPPCFYNWNLIKTFVYLQTSKLMKPNMLLIC